MPIGITNKTTQQLNRDNTNLSIRITELEKNNPIFKNWTFTY